MVKCVCYIGLGSSGCFVTSTALMGSHYRTDIINDVSHPRLDSVAQLVLCMVAYSGRDTDIVLQVTCDNANLVENG